MRATSGASEVMQTRAQSGRIHYLDNLRAIAMLLGVLLHAGLGYARPAQSVWLATDPQSSVAVDMSIWLIHLFRMGLFFLLSGYFAKLVIERQGIRKFVWNRCIRIVVPFILFYPFLLAAMTVVIVFAISYVDEPRGLMSLIATAAKNKSASTDPPPLTTMHLWFLYYLLFFSATGAFISGLKWNCPCVSLRLSKLWWLCPMVLVPGVLAAGVPLPAPESFVPKWWPFVFYGTYFVAGWLLLGRECILHAWQPYIWHIAIASLALFIPYYSLMPVLDLSVIEAKMAKNAPWLNWRAWVEAILTAYLSALLTLGTLLLGQRFLAYQSPWLRFIADSSYWVYLIHLPIVVFLQTLLIPVNWPLVWKLAAVIVGTMIPCWATYLVFVRYTPIGWMLHGKRDFP
ncbi:MAG: acyltransferase family protein [Pirellula sp.]